MDEKINLFDKQEPIFSAADMVSFGNYLLTDSRAKYIENKENIKEVLGEDLANWYFENNK